MWDCSASSVVGQLGHCWMNCTKETIQPFPATFKLHISSLLYAVTSHASQSRVRSWASVSALQVTSRENDVKALALSVPSRACWMPLLLPGPCTRLRFLHDSFFHRHAESWNRNTSCSFLIANTNIYSNTPTEEALLILNNMELIHQPRIRSPTTADKMKDRDLPGSLNVALPLNGTGAELTVVSVGEACVELVIGVLWGWVAP